ncbi:permease family-domain-containing protein [Mycena rosella]|uniref:Permease family-domain-containing protein n=1 Tax=Mycena rosella TaxID=1033263 RepID=A0AAD7D9T4_MYCRO|nr:permease family-domain-containing protein [Mycena rosella]
MPGPAPKICQYKKSQDHLEIDVIIDLGTRIDRGMGAMAKEGERQQITTQDGWLGGYDYGWLCIPSLPYSKKSHELPFYALDEELPLLLAMASGLQHALAMLAGLITPPIIFASALNLDSKTSSYMISASLIGCGILSLVQISRLPLFRGYYLGTGLISVVGTSFSALSTAASVHGTCSSTTGADRTVTRNPCQDAYGKLLGTSLICSFLEMFMAFVPARVLKRIFPPIVTGTVVVLIGAGLIGDSGALNWGGGSNGCQDFPTSGIFQLCPTLAPRPLPWASPEFIGLGFLSFNISIIVGLAVGCIVSGAAVYIDGSSIKTAPAITFLWVHTFKIGVYPPAILPMSLAMEAIGHITASAEVSKVPVQGLEFDSRIQGGILSDGLGGFLSALFTVTPLSIFAQNNVVIAITRCANRAAGRWCCAFLILFGILGKISGALLAISFNIPIPNPVLGGVTTFLFATVTVSGLRVLSYNRYTRRDRFVLAAAMSFGIGDLLVPQLFTHLFDGVNNPNSALQGFFDSITIILSTPFLAAGIIAVILNLILPIEYAERSQDLEVDDEKELESPEGNGM